MPLSQGSKPLTVIAHIYAQPDHIELVKSELKKLIKPTLAEDGCLRYDLHQGNENAAHFMFYETWQDRASWQAHMEAEALQAYLKAVDGAIASFTISEMTQVVI
ncbi:putative quinol monooxygenase [Thalassotalea euphylliae]|uniref:Antibiotic biosynthesis monooxygenase n=1 Tax=Thalassotalea euphylliae TaxID=1655234 RepID=A0A3E0UDC1_9GAMM|nr:putative quinol monooxygenase [Thalassotalea euphylliae]REL35021.1 antibiotic biosynthesis monooxygenase [Thalassotalea euphylliae]